MDEQITVEVTQDTKDVFQSIRHCGAENCQFYVKAEVVDKDTFDGLVELATLEFVDELEFAITARDRPKIASILKHYPNAGMVHKLLVNYVPRD